MDDGDKGHWKAICNKLFFSNCLCAIWNQCGFFPHLFIGPVALEQNAFSCPLISTFCDSFSAGHFHKVEMNTHLTTNRLDQGSDSRSRSVAWPPSDNWACRATFWRPSSAACWTSRRRRSWPTSATSCLRDPNPLRLATRGRGFEEQRCTSSRTDCGRDHSLIRCLKMTPLAVHLAFLRPWLVHGRCSCVALFIRFLCFGPGVLSCLIGSRRPVSSSAILAANESSDIFSILAQSLSEQAGWIGCKWLKNRDL